MDLKILLLPMTIVLLVCTKIVLTQESTDVQDAIELEKIFRETFSKESIARMAASVETSTPLTVSTGGSLPGGVSIARAPVGGNSVALSSEETVTFHLFTQSNPIDAYPLEVDDTENLEDSPFSSELPTKVIIHGWQSTVSESWIKNMTENYLTVGDHNIIGVDWSVSSMKGYVTSEQATRSVGQQTAKLLEYLNTAANMSFNDVHVLGHSLGAHIAGFAGASMSGAFSRITGMDPAGPLYEEPVLKGPSERLDSTDAIFVDVIHTCGGIVGFFGAIGHVDFYPNGGTCNQPGCTLSLTCSHGRSHDYMSDSIIYPDGFVAVQCGNLHDYENGRCSRAKTAIMGDNVSSDAGGVFYLSTNSQSPYGRGKNLRSSGADQKTRSIIWTLLLIIIMQ